MHLAQTEYAEELVSLAELFSYLLAENPKLYSYLHRATARDSNGNTLLHLLCAPAPPPSERQSSTNPSEIGSKLLTKICETKLENFLPFLDLESTNNSNKRASDMLEMVDPRHKLIEKIKEALEKVINYLILLSG